MDAVRFENVIAVLTVADLARSIAFYRDALGFEEQWGCEPGSHIGSVGRDGSAIMLSTAEGHGPTTLWLGVTNIVPIVARLNALGATMIHPPQNRPWAYEVRFEDPDGNVLWFGSDPLPE
ncbi:MAG: VOC family protein [Fimbriimonadaceae bacterium]|nr:VOC family protein [Fimbriimonadaceae bacterium]